MMSTCLNGSQGLRKKSLQVDSAFNELKQEIWLML